jgi:hypothetical protein
VLGKGFEKKGRKSFFFLSLSTQANVKKRKKPASVSRSQRSNVRKHRARETERENVVLSTMTTEHARPEKRNRVESGVDGLVVADDAAADGKTNAASAAASQASNLIIQLVSETGETLGTTVFTRFHYFWKASWRNGGSDPEGLMEL